MTFGSRANSERGAAATLKTHSQVERGIAGVIDI